MEIKTKKPDFFTDFSNFFSFFESFNLGVGVKYSRIREIFREFLALSILYYMLQSLGLEVEIKKFWEKFKKVYFSEKITFLTKNDQKSEFLKKCEKSNFWPKNQKN